MAEIKIENVSGSMQVVDLTVPAAKRVRVKHNQQALNPRTGKVGVKQVVLSLPESLIFPAGKIVEGLPAWVAQVPRIMKMIKAKPPKLKVIHPPAPPKPVSTKKTAKKGRG
jgi:hypothetical protein